jgi:hypothetical protein
MKSRAPMRTTTDRCTDTHTGARAIVSGTTRCVTIIGAIGNWKQKGGRYASGRIVMLVCYGPH